jgi:Putative beta-barrel porin-2, OmpL-like. bbp2
VQSIRIGHVWLFFLYENAVVPVSIFAEPLKETPHAGLSFGFAPFRRPQQWGWGIIMKKFLLVGVSLFAVAAATGARAEDYPGQKARKVCDPYVNYKCLDAYLGDDVFTRFIRYYELEWGHDAAPADPKAPPGRRSYWPTTPQSVPPFPFTEWPYGGSQNLGVTRPSSADSPFMVAIANTWLGQTMADAHIQFYGWVNVGGNVSSNGARPGGNWPMAYAYTPNTVQLDQAVVYLERLPDTVQNDHVDWGFRLSAIYGENYRYTTSYGVASYQLLNHNQVNGYDFPMVYGEIFVPQILEGMLIRVGRYISIPDIEAQLAPNNYMYTHSMTYTFDNYTNEGVQTTTALNKNWFLQLGVSIGTEAAPWHLGQKIPNPSPNPLFPGPTMPIDPGAVPSLAAGIRWQSDNGYDSVYAVVDGINAGNWGYNNLQWKGVTWYHKFNEQWHFSWEAYNLSQYRVPNGLFPGGVVTSTPFANFNYNSPFLAQCKDPNAPWCTTNVYTTVMYINYKFSPLDNISFRPEYYNDANGQRTGVKSRYVNLGLGWQHWFSPQIEVRPEIDWDHSVDAPAYNGNTQSNNLLGVVNGPGCAATSHFLGATVGQCPNKSSTWFAGMDAIIHF